uniref:Uncharacterized protein n=1 Tax=Monodelphis domestica TaxID=13616 RepID=A0A5F8H3E0_MONDO
MLMRTPRGAGRTPKATGCSGPGGLAEEMAGALAGLAGGFPGPRAEPAPDSDSDTDSEGPGPRRGASSLLRSPQVIHSGHFMVSSPHSDSVPRRGAQEGPVGPGDFGPRSIDPTLTRLFECMSLAYRDTAEGPFLLTLTSGLWPSTPGESHRDFLLFPKFRRSPAPTRHIRHPQTLEDGLPGITLPPPPHTGSWADPPEPPPWPGTALREAPRARRGPSSAQNPTTFILPLPQTLLERGVLPLPLRMPTKVFTAPSHEFTY